MAELVSDELWRQIEPLLPPLPPRSPKGGRPRVEHRPALTGIVFVLKTGIPWQDLPTEMGCGSGSTAGGGLPIGRVCPCGQSSMRCCSRRWARQERSTSSGR